MENSYIITILALFGLLFSSSLSKQASINNGESIQGVYYLGRVEDKTFYIDRPTTRRNWTEARDFCTQANLRLAGITTSQQEVFLLNALANLTDVVLGSWTAGRTTRTLSQFVWDHAPNFPVSTNLSFWYGVPEHQACLVLIHIEVERIWYNADPCSKTHGTLCESIE